MSTSQAQISKFPVQASGAQAAAGPEAYALLVQNALSRKQYEDLRAGLVRLLGILDAAYGLNTCVTTAQRVSKTRK